jgi:hypothetical protein
MLENYFFFKVAFKCIIYNVFALTYRLTELIQNSLINIIVKVCTAWHTCSAMHILYSISATLLLI